MNRDDVYKILRSEIENFTWSNEPDPSWIELSEKLEGQINLSEILLEAFNNVPKNQEIDYDFERFDFKIRITGDFESLRIDNRFPSELVIRNCVGGEVQVSPCLDNKFETNKLLSLAIHYSEVENIMIIGNIHRLRTRGIKNCIKFEINQINIKDILPNKYSIRGSIRQIHLLGISAEHIIIEIDTLPSNFAEVKVKVPQISKLDISADAEWDLSIYDEGRIDSLRISSKQKIRSIGINSIVLKESQINLLANECGMVKFTEVRSIEFFKILCDVSIPDCVVDSIILTGCSLQRTFNGKFSNFNIRKNISFEHFINYGDFSFEYITIGGRMVCLNSVLGRFILFNSDIGNILDLDGSNIEDVKFLGTKMPKSIVVYGLLPGNTAEIKQMEGYRQLKQISEKSGNREQASFYRSKELNTHLESLNGWKNSADKFVLLANKYSNNHGMNWIQPALLIFFIVGPILYSTFICSLGYVLDISAEGLETSKSLLRYYFDFLIPGYLYPTKDKFSFLKEVTFGENTSFGSLTIKSKCIVFINDIVVMPYLIIQLITAFRKHGGK